jgi:hypothetical protein
MKVETLTWKGDIVDHTLEEKSNIDSAPIDFIQNDVPFHRWNFCENHKIK